MHESILIYRNRRYLWLAVAITAAALLAYAFTGGAEPANGGTWLGYTLGTVATALILLLIAFGIRKRRYQSTLGKVEGWLSAHVYLGMALLVVATLHTGFQFGLNVHTLAYILMLLVIATGVFGVYAYLRYPQLLSRNRGDLTIQQMLDHVGTIDDQCLRISASLPADINEVVSSAINRTEVGGGAYRQLSGRDYSRVVISGADGPTRLVSNPDQEVVIDWLARRQAAATDGDIIAAINELEQLLAARKMMLRRIRTDIRLQALLQLWLYLHIPLSIALLGAVLAHIIVVFTYW